MKLVYLSTAGLMVLFAALMFFARGWLWGVSLLGASAALAFLGYASEDEDGSGGSSY